MEEEDKGGTWKPVEKASLLPATKPRPAPRKRSHQPKPDITIENGKPENIPPKPAVHPKPRRPPPKAPNLKTPETVGKGVILINNNNLSADKEPLGKQGLVNKAIKNNEIRVPKIESSVKSVTECNDTSNGPVNDSADDQQLYEPLRPTVSGSSSSSDEGYEAISVPRASKITPPSQRKASGVAGNSNQVSLSSKEGGTEPHKAITTTGKASPPTSHKISGTGPKFSPPVPRKVISQGSKFSPPTPRKPIGVASKTSPPVIRKIGGFKVETTPPSFRKASETRQPEAVKDLSPNTSPRTLDPSTASNKSKPLPPKKPLPSLPKDLASAGQTTTTEANKPPVPHKPPPDLSSSSKGESSVAALAQKLSTIPVFPFRDNGSSPRPSPHPSPRPSRSQASNSPGDKSDSKPALGSVKPAEPFKPKLLPKPGGLPVKPQAGNEVQKQLPGRPSAPSAEVVARTRSKTVESLEDNDSDTPSETSVVGTETQKKRLATQRKTLHPVVNRSSSNGVQASRRPPPLPPGATPVTEKATVLKGPPLPPVPRPRPVSAYDHTQGGGVKLSVSKSVSMSAISNVSLAEDQSQYSYAYEHAFIGTSPPMSASSAHSPARAPTDEAGGTYETPDDHVVSEFMEDIQEKRAAAAAYETADEQAVAGFVSSLKRKHTLNGLQCDLSTDESDFSDSDHDYTEPPTEEKDEDEEDGDDHNDASSEHSFSSDSSHDYCVPPESISPPEPPNNYGDVYDEVDDLYAEPIHKSDGEGFSSDEERDTFAEEPLYQVYTRCTLQRQRSISRQRMGSDSSDKSLTDDEAFLEQLEKGTLRNMRVLWCELPEVQESGILDNIKREERKRQEAMFEVITSEASYLRSLNILMSQFIKSEELNAGSSLCVLERGQSHVLFSNINSIKSVSENFLQALRARQKEALVISSISDIIEQHATQYFEVYVKYCSNQIYQDRTLRNLRKSVRFSEAMKRLQSRREVQGLTLQSFLVLPMQRITRLPLLVNAICQHCEAGSEEFNRSNRALAAINKIVNDCNEGARKMERMEEICVLQTQIEFKTKPLALATPSRYLLRRGDLMQVVEDSKSPLKRLKPKLKSIYMFLFNDLLLLAKKKSENRFQVLDYATRNMTQVEEPQELDMSLDHVFSLVLLENSDSKTKEFLMAANSETDKTRWMEAFKPPAAEQEGETVYASWDCPQVNALHNYTAQQPDELSLYEGDVINVLKKLPDGWYHGERLCDGTQGWFPANHTEEILNEHVRARNLRQRYRLLAASKHLIGGTLRL
ncbi:uncharacterized protein [Porites lutea]